MALLLDTHTLMWLEELPGNIPQKVKEYIYQEPEVYFSLASVWEIAIKLRTNKLRISLPLPDYVAQFQNEYQFQLLHVKLQHTYLVQHLPLLHRDPFDRILVAQSQVENIPIVSVDDVFDDYGVQRVWSWIPS